MIIVFIGVSNLNTCVLSFVYTWCILGMDIHKT
jgi:hypothetical protein